MRTHAARLLAIALATATACTRDDSPSRSDAVAAGVAEQESASPAATPAPRQRGFQALAAPANAPGVVPEMDLSKRAADEASFAGRGVAGGVATATGGATTLPPSSVAQGTGEPATPAMIIRTGHVTVKVDSLDAAIALVRQLATRLGGYVASTSVSGGDNQLPSAALELKLPAARFDEAVSGLHPIGEVEAVSVNAEDVGEEFVDVSARVANARRLEERLVDLLARRTGKLEDVLAVERELARVRGEIERYEGRLRYLRTRTAMSTLVVNVHEPLPVLARQPGVNPIAEAFRDAWRNFVALTAAVIASMGVVVPVAAVGLMAWLGWRRLGWRMWRGA